MQVNAQTKRLFGDQLVNFSTDSSRTSVKATSCHLRSPAESITHDLNHRAARLVAPLHADVQRTLRLVIFDENLKGLADP
ncbi:hypothetical protein ACQI5H_15830 [Mycobacterium heidelbergense]|uniref:hypothetical protein n=1 Tax=Mycobacterium heidelbergense TaxID=53376 RepID=UPI003CEC5641